MTARSICTIARVAAYSRAARNALRFLDTSGYTSITKPAIGTSSGGDKEAVWHLPLSLRCTRYDGSKPTDCELKSAVASSPPPLTADASFFVSLSLLVFRSLPFSAVRRKKAFMMHENNVIGRSKSPIDKNRDDYHW